MATFKDFFSGDAIGNDVIVAHLISGRGHFFVVSRMLALSCVETFLFA